MIDVDKKYTPPEKYKPKAFNPNKKPEKVRGFTVASFTVLMILSVLKYLLDFLLLPKLFPDLYPISTTAIVIWVVETIIFCSLCIKFVTGFSYFYILAFLLYAILVAIWPNELFGIGVAFPSIVGAIIAYAASRIIEQLLLLLFIALSFIRM